MLKIGICGLGTVGQSTLDHIIKFKNEIRSNVTVDFELSHVADLDVSSKNLHDLNLITSNDALELAKNPDISIIIELIGGTSAAYTIVTEALRNKKHVITANKALIAEHGDEIFRLAKEEKVYFGFEASHQVHGFNPQQGVPCHSSSDGIKVRKGSIEIVSWKQNVLGRPMNNDLIIGLSGCMIQHQVMPGQIDF